MDMNEKEVFDEEGVEFVAGELEATGDMTLKNHATAMQESHYLNSLCDKYKWIPNEQNLDRRPYEQSQSISTVQNVASEFAELHTPVDNYQNMGFLQQDLSNYLHKDEETFEKKMDEDTPSRLSTYQKLKKRFMQTFKVTAKNEMPPKVVPDPLAIAHTSLVTRAYQSVERERQVLLKNLEKNLILKGLERSESTRTYSRGDLATINVSNLSLPVCSSLLRQIREEKKKEIYFLIVLIHPSKIVGSQACSGHLSEEEIVYLLHESFSRMSSNFEITLRVYKMKQEITADINSKAKRKLIAKQKNGFTCCAETVLTSANLPMTSCPLQTTDQTLEGSIKFTLSCTLEWSETKVCSVRYSQNVEEGTWTKGSLSLENQRLLFLPTRTTSKITTQNSCVVQRSKILEINLKKVVKSNPWQQAENSRIHLLRTEDSVFFFEFSSPKEYQDWKAKFDKVLYVLRKWKIVSRAADE